MNKFFCFIFFLVCTSYILAQNTRKIILWDVDKEELVKLFATNSSNNKIIYSNNRGELYLNANDSIMIDDGFYESIYLKSNEINDTLFLYSKTFGLEEVIVNTFNSKYLNPFNKNYFKDREGSVITFPIGTKHEFISKVKFDDKYQNSIIKEIKARVIIDGLGKHSIPYFRINIYDDNLDKIYSSIPFSNVNNKFELTHVLEDDIFILDKCIYFGLEVIGLVDENENLIETDYYYTRLSLHQTGISDFKSTNYMHSVNNSKLYEVKIFEGMLNSHFFGFVIK